jgi:hypothetical protein
MVSRSRFKAIMTGLALYAIAAALITYFGINAYTGKYGLNARQELDQEIVLLTTELAGSRPSGPRRKSVFHCFVPTGSTPTCSTNERVTSSTMCIRAISG